MGACSGVMQQFKTSFTTCRDAWQPVPVPCRPAGQAMHTSASKTHCASAWHEVLVPMLLSCSLPCSLPVALMVF